MRASGTQNGLGARIYKGGVASFSTSNEAAKEATGPLDPFDGIPRAIVARAEANAEIVAAFRAFKARSCRTIAATLESFTALYNDGQIEVSAGARELYGEVSARSIERKWRKFEKLGIAGLILVYGNRRGSTIIGTNAPMRDFAIAAIAHNPRVDAPWLRDGIRARFPGERIPSLSAVQKFIRAWKLQNPSLYLRLKSPDKWKSRHMLALGDADANITRVGQLWETDGTPADAYVLGTLELPGGRWDLMAVIDVCSRMPVVLLVPVESSDGFAKLCIKAIPILGVPTAIHADNGAAFVAQRTQRGCARLGISLDFMRAYSGWLKPFIERFFRTALHSFLANLPGYIGCSVVQAAEIRDRNSFKARRGERRKMRRLYRIELTAPELQELLDKWVVHVYGNRQHSGLGRTPNEVIAEADRRGEIKRVADDRLLDLLLAEDGTAVIGKKGLRCGNAFYWDDALVEHVGQTVQFVRTRDQGRLIVYTADSAPRFICIAVDPESAGMDRQVLAIAAKQAQSADIAAKMEEVRALKRKHRPETVYREILENAAATHEAALRGGPIPDADSRVDSLPWRSPALTAAAAALEALEKSRTPEPHDEETLREAQIALDDIEHRRELRDLQLDDDELDALWLAIRNEPRVLTLREQRYLAHFGHNPDSWADNYETTDEFRALKLRLSAA